MSKIGIYPGTFDPMTNGHLNIIKRSLKVVDKLIIGVADNLNKKPLLSIDERKNIISNDKVVKVSVVGVGMRSHPGVAQKMFSTLGDKGINIYVISTSEIKVSVLIDEEYTELAVRSLHTVYGLDES